MTYLIRINFILFVLIFSLEMLDRTEAPQIQEGYGISVAYACLIEIVRSIALFIGGPEYVKEQDYEMPGMSEFHYFLSFNFSILKNQPSFFN